MSRGGIVSNHRITDSLQAAQMEAESGCSRCERRIPLLAFAFLGSNFEAVCNHCAAKQIDDLIAVVGLPSPPSSLLGKLEAEAKAATEAASAFRLPEEHAAAEYHMGRANGLAAARRLLIDSERSGPDGASQPSTTTKEKGS